jgi:hypothetical protein
METKNAINIYTCKVCGWKAITKNLEEGVTPAFIGCEGNDCDKHELPACISSMYHVPQNLQPTHEWYKPTEDELMRKTWMLEHVFKGGLVLRKVGDLEESYKR